jgi:hypothetical protein
MGPSTKSPTVTSPKSAKMGGGLQTARWNGPSNSREATTIDVKPAVNEDTEAS